MTAPVLSSSTGNQYSPTWTNHTPGISQKLGSTTTYNHAGIKNNDAQSQSATSMSAVRDYDAWGNIIASSGTFQGRFGYGGFYGYQEDETGLKLLGHRFYDSLSGRFLTRDKIKAGRNWYGYCDNNPLAAADPSGLKPRPLTPKELAVVLSAIELLKDVDYALYLLLWIAAMSGNILADDELGLVDGYVSAPGQPIVLNGGKLIPQLGLMWLVATLIHEYVHVIQPGGRPAYVDELEANAFTLEILEGLGLTPGAEAQRKKERQLAIENAATLVGSSGVMTGGR